jgi:hypothetical protein
MRETTQGLHSEENGLCSRAFFGDFFERKMDDHRLRMHENGQNVAKMNVRVDYIQWRCHTFDRYVCRTVRRISNEPLYIKKNNEIS